MIKYCSMCQQDIEPKRKFSWPLFIFFFFISGFSFGIPVLLYLLWYCVKGPDSCPNCGNDFLLPK